MTSQPFPPIPNESPFTRRLPHKLPFNVSLEGPANSLSLRQVVGTWRIPPLKRANITIDNIDSRAIARLQTDSHELEESATLRSRGRRPDSPDTFRSIGISRTPRTQSLPE